MRTDQVGDISIYVIESSNGKKRVGYKFWVSTGDLFHLLMSDSTPTTTLSDLIETSGEGSTSDRPIKVIPLTMGLNILEEEVGTNASKALSTFQTYLNDHKEEIEMDYDTEKEEDTEEKRS
jgi:hypothetical protein